MSVTVTSLSFSSVDTYISCPEKFLLQKVDHVLMRGISAAALMGTCLHTAAESFYRGLLLKTDLTVDILYRVFLNKWNQAKAEEVVYSAKEKSDLLAKGRELLELLVKEERPHQILGVERPISYQLTPSLKIVGKADLISRDKDNWLTITDLKSSAKAYGLADRQKAASQLFTYALAMKEPVKLRVKLFIKTKEPRIEDIIINPDEVNEAEWRQRFLGVAQAISAKIRYRNRTYFCATCGYNYICNAESCTATAAEDYEYREAA